MIIRLRSRDGLERLEVDDNATLDGLKLTINQKLGVGLQDLVLSRNQQLLTTKTPEQFRDLASGTATLRSLAIQHGELLYMFYHGERNVEPVVKKSILDSRPFGAKITIQEIMAKQTRIERQDKAPCTSVSFDGDAANMFQTYVQAALAFSIKRGGLLYGTVDEAGAVKVEFIYEPPQQGSDFDLVMERGTAEEQQVDYLAGLLGLKKVGWIFSQSTNERGFITSTQELMQIAAMQDELGPLCVTIMVSFEPGEGGGNIHFEAYQVSDLCVRLWKEGWFVAPTGHSGVSAMRNPKEPGLEEAIIVAGKDAKEVDNDYFLLPIGILQHQGMLHTNFPIENRLLPQGKSALKEQLSKLSSKPYVERVSDLHMLLWLSKQPGLEDPADMNMLCAAVREQGAIMEGHRFIIDSIAGIAG